MSQSNVETVAGSMQYSDLAAQMLKYRWICYGMLLLTYIFVYFDRVAPAVIAPELMKEFGLTATSLGILSSMYFYPYAAMQIPSGILSDRFGPRISVTVFFIIAAIGTALFGLAYTFGWIIVGRFLMGVGVAVVWIPCMRILANWFRPKEFATLTGVMLTVGNAGAVLAAAPLAFLVGIVGWRASFYWLGAFMAIVAILNYIILRNKPSDKNLPTVSEIDGVDYYSVQTTQKVTFSENVKRLFGMKNYWLIAIYAFVIYGTVMGFQGLWCIPFLQQTYGLPKQEAANILMLWPIGMAVGCFAFGYISDRILKSRRNASFYGIIIYALTWVPLVFWPDKIPVGMFYPLLFIMGFFSGAYVPNYAHIAEGQPHSFIATANGMLNIWYFVGGALFQAVMGMVLDSYGKVGDKFPVSAYQASFIACIIALAIGAIAMFFTADSKVLQKKA
ncbi:MFS transporter [Desulfomonile tiedjei]|uniref:Lysosomal dipeptide transporter MFSD1 n=1 Tax=Desulfomonile tiedjei (strain ATCC 49306 / DSM 6799 / DCB-1) TaxID=706587 RepID=I4CEF7_DESTA|nr:MFS transporter [Desulfomonile tiedjei]AFM27948.1 sugar phosphate permease [Desulfomonile tiedjei DSM 6799]